MLQGCGKLFLEVLVHYLPVCKHFSKSSSWIFFFKCLLVSRRQVNLVLILHHCGWIHHDKIDLLSGIDGKCEEMAVFGAAMAKIDVLKGLVRQVWCSRVLPFWFVF